MKSQIIQSIQERPMSVNILLALLLIKLISDLYTGITKPDLYIFAVIGLVIGMIIGLWKMAIWGFWLVIDLFSFEVLLSLADLTIFLESNIQQIALLNNLFPLDSRKRSIIQSSLIFSFLTQLVISTIIIYYLGRRKKFFGSDVKDKI
ncbi:MAG: hypothetical protein ACW981_00950 [Candidatus Hodarchaeales archaeon]|jgi:hypothetical protein